MFEEVDNIIDQLPDITEQPIEIIEQPADITDQPADITDQPADITDQPTDINNHNQHTDIMEQTPDNSLCCIDDNQVNNDTPNMHSKIEKLYVLNVVELISSIWGYCTIMSVGLTVLGRIN